MSVTVTLESPRIPDMLVSVLNPSRFAVAAEFQNMALSELPAALPAKDMPWYSADCSRIAKPPAATAFAVARSAATAVVANNTDLTTAPVSLDSYIPTLPLTQVGCSIPALTRCVERQCWS